MKWIALVCAAVVFLFSLAMAVMTLTAPERVAEMLGIGPVTGLGLNTVRADVGAFFLAAALGSGGAIVLGKVRWLSVPLLLYGLAVLGRLLGLAVSGVPEGVAQPIIIELIAVGLSWTAMRLHPSGRTIR